MTESPRRDGRDLVHGPPWGAVAVAVLPTVLAAACAVGTIGVRGLGWALGVAALFASLYVKQADVRLTGPRYVGAKTIRVVIPVVVLAAVAVLALNAGLVAWEVARR